jgi:uncharacterized Fe-S cluster-containing radical SAM superfamily protein
LRKCPCKLPACSCWEYKKKSRGARAGDQKDANEKEEE